MASPSGYALTGSLTLDASGLATAASLSWANSAYSNPTVSQINSKGVSGYNPIAVSRTSRRATDR